MFSLLLLLTPALNNLPAVASSPPQLQSLSSYTKVIESEDCQSKELRSFDLFNLEGHKLNKFIYFQTKSVLKDARNAGHNIKLNSAFRSCQEQNQLRSSNCSSTSLPAESCSPPTEKPGDSLHNYGMAVDFKCEGYPVFGSSPCYKWLRDNASKYKFLQREEEPWHWSLTGR